MLDDQISGGIAVFKKIKQGTADAGMDTMECEILYLPVQCFKALVINTEDIFQEGFIFIDLNYSYYPKL